MLALVNKWNRHYNLTAIRQLDKMVSHHLLDSLVLLPHLASGARLIDVGTGAGFPGIPLAIAEPQRHISLLDSSLKRCRFLRQATAELALSNTAVIESRAELATADPLYDGVICRAFAPLPKLLKLTGHLCRAGGFVYALKGQRPEEELASLTRDFKLEEIIPLQVPGLTGSRHLIVLRKT